MGCKGELHAISGGALRHTVNDRGEYLLNSVYDFPIYVKLRKETQEQALVLEPLELKSIVM